MAHLAAASLGGGLTMPARNPETTLRRDEIVRRFNRGLTQREIASALGLTRGAVGRELAHARAMGTPMVRYTTAERSRRSAAAERANVGEVAYRARMERIRNAHSEAASARRAKARARTDEGVVT